MREDLFKKTMSGDGVAGRKPYGIMTRMLQIIGWKRIELNRLLRFSSVSESNFPSIMRRSFVWKPKARFLDADYLANHYPGHAKVRQKQRGQAYTKTADNVFREMCVWDFCVSG
jgi:hypothetical protein